MTKYYIKIAQKSIAKLCCISVVMSFTYAINYFN